MTVAIQSLGTFQLHFPEENWADSFNCYEVLRSRVGEAGPYEELHSNGFMAAGFLIPDRTAYDVDTLVLEMVVNRTIEVSIVFSGTTPANVVTSFNSAMPSVIKASLEASGGIYVETVDVGHDATMLVTSSDAWTKLHMTDTYFFGSSTYPALIPDQSTYIFQDPAAEDGWYYKTRYVDRVTGEKSALSVASPADVNVGADMTELIRGEIYVTDPAGRPVENILVMLDVKLDPTKPGMMPAQLQQFTDVNGCASFLVRRGVVATIGIAGTNLYREIAVPTTGDSFDLADSSLSTQPDAYAVQETDVRVGVRRSM